MASTYSTNLKLELMGTGDQSGTWGDTTNTNMGTLLEQAVVGYTTQAITDGADTVLTIANGASSVARNYVLQLTGALTANRNLIVPAIQKPYIISNATTGGFSVTVKVSGQTGVTVANGKRALVYNNGTDIIEFANAPVTEAGTQTLTNKTLTSPTLTTPTLSGTASGTTAGRLGYLSGALSYGTGSVQRTVVNTDEAQTLTNKTLTTPILSGTASGTTSGAVGYLSGALSYGTGSVQRTVVNTDESQTLTNKTMSTGSVWSGTTIGVASGGTGATSLTANNVILGNGTSAVQFVSPGTSGNVLTSNGTTWQSIAPTTGVNVQSFTSSGTWTKPSGVRFVRVFCWGGGGSGGRNGVATGVGGGGGGGQLTYSTFDASWLPATVSVTIGAGGAGVSGAAGGNDGGNTTFGTYLIAAGGAQGGWTASGTGNYSGGAPGGAKNCILINANNATVPLVYFNCGFGGQGDNVTPVAGAPGIYQVSPLFGSPPSSRGNYTVPTSIGVSYTTTNSNFGDTGWGQTADRSYIFPWVGWSGGGGGGACNAAVTGGAGGGGLYSGSGGGGASNSGTGGTGGTSTGISIWGFTSVGGNGGTNGGNGTNGSGIAAGGGGAENTTSGAGTSGACYVEAW